MLQMVEAGRGVAALPRWLAEEYQEKMAIAPVKLGKHGLAKQIFLGLREPDMTTDYVRSFVTMAETGQ